MLWDIAWLLVGAVVSSKVMRNRTTARKSAIGSALLTFFSLWVYTIMSGSVLLGGGPESDAFWVGLAFGGGVYVAALLVWRAAARPKKKWQHAPSGFEVYRGEQGDG